MNMKPLPLLSGLLCAGCLQLFAQMSIVPSHQDPRPSSCSLIDPQLQAAENMNDSTLLAAYNGQADRIRSMHVEALMRARAGKEYRVGEQQREMPVLLDLVRPDLVRVTGVVASMSSRGFEMASDGKEFRLLIPENGRRRFLVGPADAPAQSQNPRENLRPQPIVDALLWRDGTLSRTLPVRSADPRDRTLNVDLPRSRAGERTATIDFDLSRGTVNALTVSDASGAVVSEAKYSDWTMIDSSPEEPATGCFPRKVQFREPAQNYEITLRILRVVFNLDIPKSAFRPSPPKGVPVVPLIGPAAKESR
jgi:outer membrane lipoprotein-sorting protein